MCMLALPLPTPLASQPLNDRCLDNGLVTKNVQYGSTIYYWICTICYSHNNHFYWNQSPTHTAPYLEEWSSVQKLTHYITLVTSQLSCHDNHTLHAFAVHLSSVCMCINYYIWLSVCTSAIWVCMLACSLHQRYIPACSCTCVHITQACHIVARLRKRALTQARPNNHYS